MSEIKLVGLVPNINVCFRNIDRFEFAHNTLTTKAVMSLFFFQDLVEFSKEKGVNLHTHNDEREILPTGQLDSLLSPAVKGQAADHTHWNAAWVIKYSAIIRLRGIISHKGYVKN